MLYFSDFYKIYSISYFHYISLSFIAKFALKRTMPKFKVTHNVKPKRTQQAECATFQELNNWIDKTFNIEIAQIKYQKPRIKDQPTFAKQVKEGIQITFMGNVRKEKTLEQLEKQKIKMEQIQKLKEEIMLNPHQIILKKLKEKGIEERGIEYFDPQQKKPKDLGIQYALCPLHLFKRVPQFVKYCETYEVMQKNPDGLIIEELRAVFKQLDKGKKKKIKQNQSVSIQLKEDKKQQNDEQRKQTDGVVCPLEWISAWITYCADDIEFPYPTYDIDYFLNKTFGTIRNAFDVQQQKKQQEANSKVDTASKFFGIQVLTKRTDITQLDEDDTQANKQVDKKVTKYFLECDLSKPQFNNLLSGIKQRLKQKILWRNFYAFDIEYKQKIISIERLPKYIFIHANRFGYMPAKQESEKVDLSQNKKSYHRVRCPRTIDLYDLCDNTLKQKLQAGRYQRHQMFYPYDMDDRFPQFKKSIKYVDELSDVDVRYLFFDHILHKCNVFHEYNFENVKGAKPTGQYRIMGVILHKGDYYHHWNDQHKHQNKQDCRGDFMAMVYDRGTRWLKFHKANVQVVDIQEATNQKYWGKQGEWTPVLFMYKQIRMKHLQVEPQNKKDQQKRKKKQEIERLQNQENQGR